MTVISLRIDEKEDRLIKEYAKAKIISVSALIRNSVLEKLEDEFTKRRTKEAANNKGILFSTKKHYRDKERKRKRYERKLREKME